MKHLVTFLQSNIDCSRKIILTNRTDSLLVWGGGGGGSKESLQIYLTVANLSGFW